MSGRRLSGLDSLMLAAESDRNQMQMLAVMRLDPSTMPGGYRFEKLRDFIEERLGHVPPLHRKLLNVPLEIARPIWVDALDFDIDRHVIRAAVPSPGTRRELAEMAGRIAAGALDRDHPLWQIHVVEGLEGGGIALIAKLHHALMDGMAGLRFMANLVTTTPGGAGSAPAKPFEPSGRAPGPLRRLLGALPEVVGRPERWLQKGGGALLDGVRSALKRESASGAASDSAPACLLSAPITQEREVAFGTLDLERVKAVGHRMNATVNDVVLCLVAESLRPLLRARGQADGGSLVAAVPASTHAAGGDDLANSYGVLLTSLRTDIADPALRLAAIRDASRTQKARRGGGLTHSLMELLEVPSPIVMKTLMRGFFDLGLATRLPPLCNVIISNVPGPPVDLYLGGARIEHIHPLGPIFDTVGLNTTFISSGGGLDYGLLTCPKIGLQPWEVTGRMERALEALSDSSAPAPPPLHAVS